MYKLCWVVLLQWLNLKVIISLMIDGRLPTLSSLNWESMQAGATADEEVGRCRSCLLGDSLVIVSCAAVNSVYAFWN